MDLLSNLRLELCKEKKHQENNPVHTGETNRVYMIEDIIRYIENKDVQLIASEEQRTYIAKMFDEYKTKQAKDYATIESHLSTLQDYSVTINEARAALECIDVIVKAGVRVYNNKHNEAGVQQNEGNIKEKD